MPKALFSWYRAAQAAAACTLVGLVAACDSAPPAPVELGGAPAAPGAAPYAVNIAPSAISAAPIAPGAMSRAVGLRPMTAAPPQVVPPEGVQIVVRPGQSVGGLAEQYHVTRRDIIAANHLQPPYGIEIGQHLLIPGGARRTEVAAAAPSPERRAVERAAPEIIPLDGPAPSRPAPSRAAPPPSAVAAQTIELGAPPSQVAAARAAAASHGTALVWPVQGRIVAGYGAASGDGRNDGINIAAPLGAPVHAVDGGIVAYVGNQLRGYGNLVLIKHPDGFISAYAHCETLLVRKGEQVARGQVIAKVGATGGVAQPQLHFELRRGEEAVDPRQFLGRTPAAQTGGMGSG
jgi:murein DD-endopeptidase MepM/ murein hydrolase activator NlpD